MTKLLEVSNLTASYGHTVVLRGISFAIEEGGVTALLGANGAGKTTTLRALCGMIHSGGDITFAGRSIVGLPTEEVVRLGVAHVPDGRGTFVRQTVEENLELGAIVRQDRAGIVRDKDLVYSYFPILKQRRAQQAGTLSGGEQQMLAVGRALMLRPKLMLLDEPSFGIGRMVVREIFEILGDLNKKEGVSMLIVEQNAALALGLADNAFLLETGRIAFSGLAAEMRHDEAIRRSYLGY